MKVAIYGRVSTKRQIEKGSGLDVQLEELIKEVEKSGQDYVEYMDEGISGTSLEKREGLQKLLEDIKKGDISEVHVTKLSRLGRNTRDVLNVLHEFDKYNVKFKSVRDNIDTSSPMGKVMVQFMSIIAEMERDVIIETTKAGSEYRAAIGKIYGSPPILGYRRVGNGKNSYLEIDEDEAQIVKLIYDLYNKDYGYKAIVTKLNRSGYRSKKGNLFALNTVKTILTNPLYAGKIRYNYHKDWMKKHRRGKQKEYILVDGLHKGIIDQHSWDQVQERMSKNSKHKEKVSGKFLLNGILKCPQCGSGMVGSNRYQYHNNVRKTVAYYICGAHHNKGRSACGANTIKSEKVEDIVLKQISRYIKQPGLEKILYDYIVQNISDTSKFPARLKVLNSDFSILEAKIARVKEMFVEGFITNIELKMKLNEHLEAQEKINSEIDSIKTQLQAESTPELDITMEDIREILDRLFEIFTKTDDRLLLKRFLNSMVDSIEVKDRLKADMKVKINFSDGIIRMFEKQLPAYLAFNYQREI